MSRRQTWAEKTRSNTQAAKTLARAFNEKPIIEVRDGEEWRVWPKSHIATNEEVSKALTGVRAIEESELSFDLPPSAIKDAVSRKWLARWGTMLVVTEKGAEALKLPRRNGAGAIKFAKVA